MVASLGIALSGLTAQTRRVEASASNVANLRTTGALPTNGRSIGQAAVQSNAPQPVYQPIGVAQTNANPGTRASFTPITPAYLPEYAPDDPGADANGLIAAPNVDLATERINQIAASRAYGANINVARTQDEMLTSLLDSKV